MESKNTWDLSPLLKSDNDLIIKKQRKIIKEQNYKFINKWNKRSDYLTDPKILKQALDEYNDLQTYYAAGGNEGYYFGLRESQEQTNPKIKAKLNQVDDFAKKIGNDLQFFELRLAKVTETIQRKFLAYKSLGDYKHFLERLFASAKYQLSEPEEKIMTLVSKTSYGNWVSMLGSFLSKEEREVFVDSKKKEKKTFSELFILINNPNKKARDSAAKALNEVLVKYVEVAESELNSVLEFKKIADELRGSPRPDFMRHLGDDVDSEVVDTLIKAVSSKFDIAKRYYKLKAKLMNVKKLEYHERNVNYGKIDKKIKYSEAVELVSKVLANLDKEFYEIFNEFVSNNLIDVYPRKGKRGGAFCTHHLISQPTYLLLNYGPELREVTTLAHEVGHGINNELVKKKQNAINFGTPLSTAEVASTFMEDFVLQELMEESDDELRLALMMMRLNDDVSTIFRQIACYMFEQELHKEFRKKGYLSKEEIGKLFQKHMEAYMGSAVEQSKGSEKWWVYWSHIRAFFYNYSYANGLLISKALQNSVKKDPKFIVNVKEFLAAGLSESPKSIFAKLGIDITKKSFWEKGLKEVEALLVETEKLAKKLGKL